MHISHLALVPDVLTSMLLDWTDDPRLWGCSSRERRLAEIWDNYKSWCDSQGREMDSRAGRRLFTTAVLRPDAGKYTDISQKLLSGTAARYIVFWLSGLATHFALSGLEEDSHLDLLEQSFTFFWLVGWPAKVLPDVVFNKQ